MCIILKRRVDVGGAGGRDADERRGGGVKLDGARCLVVGGARRLGAVIALDLAAHGADRRRQQPVGARRRRRDLRRHPRPGRRGATVTGDVAAPAGAAGLVAAAAEALGGLDVLVYAASGPFRPAAPQDIDPRDWQTSFDVVARGFFVAACAARERFVGNDARGRRRRRGAAGQAPRRGGASPRRAA